VYAVVGVLWILFSDHMLAALVPDAGLRNELQSVKGAAFVVLTSLLLFELVRRGQRSLVTVGTEIRAAVESLPDAVLIVDAREQIVEVNRAALRLFGTERKEDLLGPVEAFARRLQLRRLEGAPVEADQLAGIRALRGERTSYGAVLRRLDGREIFVTVDAAPMEAESLNALAVVVVRDVSAARRLDDMRDEFLATAAHELKTPLAVIQAYAQLVQRRAPGEGPALAVVQRQVERMTRMVQHLLDSSRLRLDGARGRAERFDLAALALETVERFRGSAPDHVLSVLGEGPALVEGDPERLARVLRSLLDNAVRFSPRGGPVVATVSSAEAKVIVAVKDHGVGIPPDRQTRIFERYYRAHAGTADDYGGLGLSLDMSREIVARHGGRMWFDSAPGQGSTFFFSVPLAPEAP
jgi:PAS domain S-box-containing protein